MLRPGRLAVLQPAAAPNRSGGAQRNPRPMRRQAMARNDGGSGRGTRSRSSVIRGAVSCRRRQSPRRRCPADGWAKRPDGSRAGSRLLPNDRAPEPDIRLRAGSMERGASPDPTRSHNSLAGETLGHHRWPASIASFKLLDQDLPGGWASAGRGPVGASRWPGGFPLRRDRAAATGSRRSNAGESRRCESAIRRRHRRTLAARPEQAWGAARHGGPPEVPSHQRRWRLPWSHPDAPTNAATILAFPKCSSRGISPRS